MGRTARRLYVITLVTLLIAPLPSHGAAPQDIDDAISKGKEWLYSRQTDGHWEDTTAPNPSARPWHTTGGQWGGMTALATYALLASGESPADPRIVQAIDFLKSADLRGVYALAMRAQVWSLLPQAPEVRQLILRDANLLRSMLLIRGAGRGFFDYVGASGDSYSHSRGNYGVLGLWALAQAGIDVPPELWRTVEEGWVSHQDPSGGWTYKAPRETDHPVTPGMTAAGVATLLITQDYLGANRGIDCRPVSPHPAIERGLKWLIDHFDQVAADESYPRDYPYATLYAVERVAVASGLRTFGDIDWYQHGAGWLVERQKSSGAWAESSRSSGNIDDTSFALLFLARGRSPVVMAKLDYTEDASKPVAWNNRPRDVANLVTWSGRAMERELHWQIVNTSAPLEIWHEAPILYVSGRIGWEPSDGLKAKLKNYLEGGGLLLAHADCSGQPFASSIRKLGQELFPDYDFRPLPADHPIYTHQQFPRAKWRAKPDVQGLSNGVRELILLIPQGDPGRQWQLGDRRREEVWQLPADIIQYAADQQNLASRGTTHLVTRDDAIQPERTIKLVRLQHGGNWDPEPAGWRRMADVMHNEHRVALDVSTAPLDGTPLPADAQIAHLTGTDELTLDGVASQQIRDFIEAGGTLLIDAAGGSSAFATSAEVLLAELFPDDTLERLPPDHSIYTSGPQPLGEVQYRRFAQVELGLIDPTPRLQAIERDGRIVAIYSREDLSAGLVGQQVDGIIGYAPDSATAVMSCVLLFADGE